MKSPVFAEMAAATNFSFLRGASDAQDMVLRALLLGYSGIGIADRNTLAGVVRAWAALERIREDGLLPAASAGWDAEAVCSPSPCDLMSRAQAFRLAVGARLVFADGTPDIIAYPQDRAGWAQLCRLLTVGNLRPPPGLDRAVKGECRLFIDDLIAHADGLLMVVLPGPVPGDIGPVLRRLVAVRPGAVWLGAAMHRRGDDARRLARLSAMAAEAGTPLLATNDVLYHDAGQRDLHDVMTCIREGVRLESAGRLLEANAERHLKSCEEMARLFRAAPEALSEAVSLLSQIAFDLGQLSYEYPEEPVPPGWNEDEYLAHLTGVHVAVRYPGGVPARVQRLITFELDFIRRHGLARYFLTIYDIVRFAKDRGILCQGRGSAANSAVCYALGITSVDPNTFDLLFARFMSDERREPPDIDVDFEHERREEVIQYIYTRYGRHRAGIASSVIRYRARSAMRDVGKVFGLSDDMTARLSGVVWGGRSTAPSAVQLRQAGIDADNPVIARALFFARRLIGYPRHLSQHVGGFVLARGRLDELVPVAQAAMEERTFIEWDKEDIDALKLMKVDILALGMLTCIRKAFDLLFQHEGLKLTLQDTPPEDREVYDMLCRGDSVGVFQVESRAQIAMLQRLRPRKFYDLVIEVAIVRPGPIQGNMVHPYLRRRNGDEAVTFPAPSPEHGPPDELQSVLSETYGVPLFQEQAMKLAMVAAKFSPADANRLRCAMATFRNVGTIHLFEEKMVGGMTARGYDREFAQRCFEQIRGFGSYGFPESHAAAFAQLVYVSAWLKCHHPAAFTCALLNSQPMGFYASAQLVRDAQEHGVEVRPVDANFSFYDSTLERRHDGSLALRLGFRQIDGMRQADADALIARRAGGYSSIADLRERGEVSAPMLKRLAEADAFGSLKQDRREAMWEVRRQPDDDLLPLFAAAGARELGAEPDSHLPHMALREHVAADYQTLRLSLKAHPMHILRPVLMSEQILSCRQTCELADGAPARTAGVVLVRQRPGNGKAIFITLEDETGITNVLMWARIFERFRSEVMGARLLLVEGRVQKSREGVVHLMASRAYDRSYELRRLSDDHAPDIEMTRADEIRQPRTPRGPDKSAPPPRHPRGVRIIPKSRDFR